jgi:ribosome assembly protein RRB1
MNAPGRRLLQSAGVVATWSELGVVNVWNVQPWLSSLDQPPSTLLQPHTTPLFAYAGHGTEGYALDWSPTVAGRMVS